MAGHRQSAACASRGHVPADRLPCHFVAAAQIVLQLAVPSRDAIGVVMEPGQTFGRNFRLPRWLDIPLRGLKYLLLGLFLYAVASMSVDGIRAFLDGPYGLVADVKMLNSS